MQVFALALAGLAAGMARAAEPVFSGVAEVMTNQLGGLSRISPRGAWQQVTVYFRDDAMRVQFEDATGAQYALILAKDAPTGWIVGQRGGAMPVPGMHWPLRFDPQQPCAGLGMFADCQPGQTGLHAGRPARQWRYRLANGKGPGMTRQGTMWLDTETGLVLSYRGRTGLEEQQQWEVQRVRYGPQPDALFQPPEPAAPSHDAR
jgi:hypothetical protein